jgi:hypothetical protein
MFLMKGNSSAKLGPVSDKEFLLALFPKTNKVMRILGDYLKFKLTSVQARKRLTEKISAVSLG